MNGGRATSPFARVSQPSDCTAISLDACGADFSLPIRLVVNFRFGDSKAESEKLKSNESDVGRPRDFPAISLSAVHLI